jgi:hypothetical protein
MKTINYVKTVFALAGICILSSCNAKQYHEITIAMDSTCNAEKQTATYEVINKRIASVWKVKEKTELINGRFDITYSGNNSLLTQMLAQRGEIYISETCQKDEIYPAVLSVCMEIDSLMKNAGTERLWYMSTHGSDEVIMNVYPQQVTFVDSVFNSRKHLFPADASFCWTAKPKKDADGNDLFELLILKKSPRDFPLNPTTVKTSDYYDNNRQGYKAVTIELTKPYAEEWARLTRDNISKSLAIVMDGKALMYPRVQSEITGGKLQITGDMDDELLLIKSFLLGGVLECSAEILQK